MIEDLLRHTIAVVNPNGTPGTLDPEGGDYGKPAGGETVRGTFAGLVQPRSGRERLAIAASGLAVGTYRIFLEEAAIGVVDPDDVLRKSGDPESDMNGDYRIVGEVANAAGFGHHLEIDAERIRP